LSVYGEPFERCAIGAIGSVDAVVMIDLIEHLADPRAALEKAWEMLGPRGLLLLWTPNGGAAGASLATARRWAGFRVDLDHLQYFSPGTVMALGTNRGWRIEHLETLGFPDLRRIGKTPRLAGTSLRNAVRYCASRFPGARRFAMALRAFGRELGVAALPDARLGTYHLFAILRRA
jgi:SAM-dependent methyltransferase